MLYLVPTPIGNLKDMTLRSLEVLGEVDLILAEDTRLSGKLLKHYDISTPMRSFHAHNEHGITEQIVTQLSGGIKMALITDAGTPSISDPGFLLVRACRAQDINVICLPGATAFVPVLAASGLPCDKFYFEGFLPNKKGRKTRWEYLATLDTTIVFYESPYRVLKALEEIQVHFGPERMVSIGREISKIYEEIKTASVADLLEDFKSRKSIKGEFVIVVSK
ncbi:MAG: 16S rRNA (cytidine(1402)-2'-O)-methyltransferase [Saprospiraceae bacterium]|nr:16S rRNA (cytidine(1402)-2'-O)-methyltransferase [Saprospiraceae bacterium]|tara:strand:+ start:607 stop:1269 length:663 start_codon:yes stop_codon:yes gene_type:complete